MPTLRFTDLTVRALKEGTYFDERTPSFGIRVGKHKRTWIVLKEPSRTKVRLGHYPELSLQDARKKALIVLGSPLERVQAPTFPDALNAFLAQDRWKGRSKYVIENSLRTHFRWKCTIDKITHEDVAQAIERVRTKGAAAHALKDIRTFFNWCVPRYLRYSPAVGLRMPRYVPRDRVLTDDELVAVWHAATAYPFGSLVRLLILTGQRKMEVGSLKWADVSDDAFVIPDTKNGVPHAVPLGPMAAELLAGVPKVSAFVFPGRSLEAPYNSFSAAKDRLDRVCKITPWTLHDLRRTFATNLAALGTPIHVTEKLLNHLSGTTGGLVRVYQRHSYWDEQKAAIAAWENRLAELVK